MNAKDRILKNQCIIMEALQYIIMSEDAFDAEGNHIQRKLSDAILKSEPNA